MNEYEELTEDEVIAVSPKVVELFYQLRDALKVSSPGGKRITRGERKRIITLAAELLWQLTRDAID